MDNQVSAQVILKAADVESAQLVLDHFSHSGFETGPVVGTSFSIAGPASKFENHFGVTSDQVPALGSPLSLNAKTDSELPVGRLPEAVKNQVSAVVFTKMPDFGPGNY